MKVIVTLGNLSSIIACRVNEILMPLLAEVEKTEGIGAIYLTGGASMLRGIVPFLKKKTSIPIEYGSHAQWLASDTEDEYYQPLYGPLIGTLLLGQVYREEHPDEEPQPQTVLGKFKKELTDLFGGEDF